MVSGNDAGAAPVPAIHVAPSAHISDKSLTTRWMMADVLIGLVPVMLCAIAVFQWFAILQVSFCIILCVTIEAILTRSRGQPLSIIDGSAVVTGAILGLSLPWNAPLYVAVVGSLMAIGIGKFVFGGLGYNIFNPAMVGRAFVMLSFPGVVGAAAYADQASSLRVVTEATPLSGGPVGDLFKLFVGQQNGSLGEVSVIALLIGGIYLCARRSASWEIPASAIVSAGFFTLMAKFAGLTEVPVAAHMLSGALFFGAFFIATDPVTSPVTPRGKLIFGAGFGALVVLIRVFSSYPEGVMFAILLMNAFVPLINRWAIPVPVGGPAPKAE